MRSSASTGRVGCPGSTSVTPTRSCCGWRRNLGRPSGEGCPICEESDLVEVTFVFGSRLPPGGRCVATQTELTRYWRRKEPVVCYVIEVCAGLLVEPPGPHVPRRCGGGGGDPQAPTGDGPALVGPDPLDCRILAPVNFVGAAPFERDPDRAQGTRSMAGSSRREG